MSSAIVTSLLVPGDPQPLVAQVLGADSTATTYVLNCVPGTDGNDCGTYNETITLGPWASKTLPPGADETGNFDLYVNLPDEDEGWTFSIHCQMSRSIAQGCVTTNIGGNDDDQPTATLAQTMLDEYGFHTFSYMPVTITAGQNLLSAAQSGSAQASATNTASGSAKTSGSVKTDAKTTGTATGTAQSSGSAASSAATPEKTNGASSCAARVLTAMSVAGIALSLVLS